MLCLVAVCGAVSAQSVQPPYLNASFPVEQRVDDIISRLSLSQKIKLLMHKGTAIDSNGLKIPAYNWWNECLHGVARAGKATVFPQAIGLAATWDTVLMNRVANAISDEARAKHEFFAKTDQRGIYTGLNFWTPNINIFRDPRWGRGMETYGEDPYLTGKMANAFIKGLQGTDPKYLKAIATVKHFVAHSGPEEGRSGFNASVNETDFWETYTPAFKTAVRNAGVYSLMCAYNAFRDTPCCSNNYLMNEVLRKQWGFKGFVVTDCGAVSNIYRKGAHEKVSTAEEAAALAIRAGVDLECGSAFTALDKAVAKNLVTEKELDHALRRLFTARFMLGSFDDPSTVKFTRIPYEVVESDEHVGLSLEAARKSIVLLKNSAGLLPLDRNIKTLAVIGPNANDAEVLLANYNGLPTKTITPYEGLKLQLPETNVLYAVGSPHAEGLPVPELISSKYLFTDAKLLHHGLSAEYFNNNRFSDPPAFTRIDREINFQWTNDSPAPGINASRFSVRWKGFLKVPADGVYVLDMYGSSDFEVLLNDSSLFRYSSSDGPDHRYSKLLLKAGQAYAIQVNYANAGANAVARLNWELPGKNYEEEAIKISKQADVIVLCMGLSPRIEGENMDVQLDGFNRGDRTKLALPLVQHNLIRKICELGKPVVLVLINGSALAINWEQENISAIVETWYGGQQAGVAIADVLLGKYNPAGRLPVTFYQSENDLPAFTDYSMSNRTYRYFTGKPLYEFGYGLSYTTFSYSNLKLQSVATTGAEIQLAVDVHNSGKYDGEEVVQLYVSNKNAGIQTLKGFARIHLKKGEKRTLSFNIPATAFSYINSVNQRIIAPGRFSISVGGKLPTVFQRNQVLIKEIRLTGEQVHLAL